MPEPNQFMWTHKELVTLLVKEAGIHEGRWWLNLNMGMAAGNFGPAEDQISPGVVVAISGIGIQKEAPGQTAPSALVVDAAEVNPAKPTKQAKPRQKTKSPTGS